MSRDGFRQPTLPPDFWSRFLPPLTVPPPPPPPPPSPSSVNLPVLTLSILGVLVAAIFLLVYYFVGAPFCFRRRRPDALGGSRRRLRDNFMMLSMGARGLAASEIRRIPTFQYRKESGAGGGAGAGDCAVCLGEFQEEETIRLLPGCFHVFHVNCIDTWLQSNANCPLCRATITPAGAATPVPIDRLPAFVRSRGFDRRNHTHDVVIDVKDDEGEVERRRQLRRHGSVDSRRPLPAYGPMRRSFSVGSAAVTDRRLHGEVQKIVQQNPHFQERRQQPPAEPGKGAAVPVESDGGFFSFHRRSSSSAAFN